MKRVICPCYAPYPGPEWEVIFEHTADVAFVILNVNSGVGVGRADPVYVAMAARLRLAGIETLGYVSTRYGNRPIEEVQSEIALWFSRYHVDGIFADEQNSQPELLSYYKRVKGACGTAVLVTNPGRMPDEAYRDLDAIICVSETDQANYLEDEFPAWTKTWPVRVGHIVYDVTDPEIVLARINANGPGIFYMTTVGGEDPQFSVGATIWPPNRPPAPVPSPVPTPDPNQLTENEAVTLLLQVAQAVHAPSGTTLAQVPALAAGRMVEISKLQSELSQCRAAQSGTFRLSAVPDDHIVEEVRRRFSRSG